MYILFCEKSAGYYLLAIDFLVRLCAHASFIRKTEMNSDTAINAKNIAGNVNSGIMVTAPSAASWGIGEPVLSESAKACR